MSYNYRSLSNNPEERQRIIYPYCFWENVFTNDELDEICRLMTIENLEEAPIASSDDKNVENIPIPAVNTAIRSSKVSFHTLTPEKDWVFFRLNSVIEAVNNQWFNFDLNGYDQIQYTEYHSESKGHYSWHTDIFLGPQPKNSYSETRKLSLSLLLNDPKEFEGGELQFGHDSNYESAVMKKGTAILFPSFNLHRVTPVTAGIRKSLVVWVLGPKWK